MVGVFVLMKFSWLRATRQCSSCMHSCMMYLYAFAHASISAANRIETANQLHFANIALTWIRRDCTTTHRLWKNLISKLHDAHVQVYANMYRVSFPVSIAVKQHFSLLLRSLLLFIFSPRQYCQSVTNLLSF